MITVEGLGELLAKLEPSQYAPEFQRFWQQNAEEGKRAGAAAAPRRTGQLAGSFSSAIDPSPLPSWGEVRVGAPYARPVLGGSRPHMPPVQALGGNWPMAMAIAKRGTTGRPFLGRAYRAVEAAARNGVQTLANSIEMRFGR